MCPVHIHIYEYDIENFVKSSNTEYFVARRKRQFRTLLMDSHCVDRKTVRQTVGPRRNMHSAIEMKGSFGSIPIYCNLYLAINWCGNLVAINLLEEMRPVHVHQSIYRLDTKNIRDEIPKSWSLITLTFLFFFPQLNCLINGEQTLCCRRYHNFNGL